MTLTLNLAHLCDLCAFLSASLSLSVSLSASSRSRSWIEPSIVEVILLGKSELSIAEGVLLGKSSPACREVQRFHDSTQAAGLRRT